ncbi:MAG: helix-turn-helix transcriptional regulator [Pseudomonas sp.]|nr:helix-turn-helix transcriptional regulator [Pseudomonas sp.]MDE1198022.1 helix-turn-helix transcriptional regulator [Pseudomonas sp.]
MLQFQQGNETLGTAIRRLRLEVTGFDQETFAGMCKMSTRALYQIEKDKGNPTLNTIDAILRKFGLRVGLTSAIPTPPPPAPTPQPHTPPRPPQPATPHPNPRAIPWGGPLGDRFIIRRRLDVLRSKTKKAHLSVSLFR